MRRNPLGSRLSANKENRISTLPGASERYQVLPHPVFWWRQKDGKIIWRGANPKASRCLDPDTKLKNTRGIIILQARSFLNGEAYFFLLRGAAFLSAPPATFLEPRPFFACRLEILLEPAPLFVGAKKGEAFRPLLICKLFIKFYNTIRLWYYRPNFLSTYFFKVSANVLHAFSPSE